MFTTLELTVLVLGILLLLLALIYKFCNWFTRRKSEEVVVDGREAERADQGREEIFNVSSRFQEIVSEDRNDNRSFPVTAGEEYRKRSNHEDHTEVPDIRPTSIIETSIHNECEDKKSSRIVYLSSQAIKRHIFPNCRGDKDAERFSTRRNKSSQTFKNTVLKVERWDFHLEKEGSYLRSNNKVPFWQCSRQDYHGNFQVVHTTYDKINVSICVYLGSG